MTSTVLTGHILLPHGKEPATVGVRDGLIDHVEPGIVEDADHTGMIIPGLLDMHTHLGDSGARGHLPPRLEDVVLPGGIKHGFLQGASLADRISSIRNSIEEVSPGVTNILDFREGGIEGIEVLKRALSSGMPEVHAMGRPDDVAGAEEILEVSNGIGMPSLDGGLVKIREICKREEKPFSVHVSELYRENIETVLELDPDLVIHMVSGTEDDWRLLSDAGIPVVVCPRANSAYSIDVPLNEMMGSGLSLGLGTDNAISVRQDMFREMESAWILLRRAGKEGVEASRKVFSMAVGEHMKNVRFLDMIMPATKWWENGWPRVGDPAHLAVVDDSGTREIDDPFSALVRFTGQRDVLWTGPGI